jgi:hypothetical protein
MLRADPAAVPEHQLLDECRAESFRLWSLQVRRSRHHLRAVITSSSHRRCDGPAVTDRLWSPQLVRAQTTKQIQV